MTTAIDHDWTKLSAEELAERRISEACDIAAALGSMGLDELRTIRLLCQRLEAGQRQYGKLNLATDTRDWSKERSAEILDLLMYSAFEALKGER